MGLVEHGLVKPRPEQQRHPHPRPSGYRAAQLGLEEVQPACLRFLFLFLFQTHEGLRGQAHWERVSELRSRVGAFLGVQWEEDHPRPRNIVCKSREAVDAQSSGRGQDPQRAPWLLQKRLAHRWGAPVIGCSSSGVVGSPSSENGWKGGGLKPRTTERAAEVGEGGRKGTWGQVEALGGAATWAHGAT